MFAGAGYASGGKTGTAQAVTIGQNDRYDARKLEEHQRDHALYMAFAPVDQPRVALAVMVENAGFGAAAARPSRAACSTTCCWTSTRTRKTWRR